MKTIFKINRLLLTCFIGFSITSCEDYQSAWNNKPVIKVEAFQLKAEEFARKLTAKLRIYDALSVKNTNILKQAKTEIVNEYILEILVLNWAQKNGIQVKRSLIKSEVSKIQAAYPDALSFERSLAKSGTSIKAWKVNLKNSILQKIVFERITSKFAAPTIEEVSTYYNNHRNEFKTTTAVKLRQIVLESKNNAERIMRNLRKGESFTKLAKRYSTTPESTNGGELGWIDKSTSKIFDAMFKYARGKRSSVTESKFGFHIIELLDKRKSRQRPLNEVKNIIVEKLIHFEKQKIYSEWLESELRKTKVFKDDKLIQSIYVKTRS